MKCQYVQIVAQLNFTLMGFGSIYVPTNNSCTKSDVWLKYDQRQFMN